VLHNIAQMVFTRADPRGAAAPTTKYKIIFSTQIFTVFAPPGPNTCTHSPGWETAYIFQIGSPTSVHTHAGSQERSVASTSGLRLHASPVASTARLLSLAFSLVWRPPSQLLWWRRGRWPASRVADDRGAHVQQLSSSHQERRTRAVERRAHSGRQQQHTPTTSLLFYVHLLQSKQVQILHSFRVSVSINLIIQWFQFCGNVQILGLGFIFVLSVISGGSLEGKQRRRLRRGC
jgi:hypothetical protein